MRVSKNFLEICSLKKLKYFAQVPACETKPCFGATFSLKCCLLLAASGTVPDTDLDAMRHPELLGDVFGLFAPLYQCSQL